MFSRVTVTAGVTAGLLCCQAASAASGQLFDFDMCRALSQTASTAISFHGDEYNLRLRANGQMFATATIRPATEY